MADRSRAEQLRQLLRAELVARLALEGWREVGGAAGRRHRLTVFARPIDIDLEQTAEIFLAGRWPDRPPVVIGEVQVGISYEPLRRLYPLLGDFEFSVAVGWPGFDEDVDVDQVNEAAGPDDAEDHQQDEDDVDRDLLELRTEADVPAVADRLASLVTERSAGFGEEPASVDSLLNRIGSPASEQVSLGRAAVLAAAGRYEEAGRALDRWKPGPHTQPRASGARTARQLRRWIESRGDPALIPNSPTPDPLEHLERPSIGENWRESRARDAAVKHVRARAEGKDRAQLREMLEAELARRGVNDSRARIESTLDHLHDSKAEQIRTTVEIVGRLARGVLKLVRAKQIPDFRPPDWLDPPERAVYELPLSRTWIEVTLTDDARKWLDEVNDDIPSMFGVSTVKAWLSPDPEPRQENSIVQVHLGERTVGRIDPDHVNDVIPVIDAAAFRDELPLVQASLARRAREPRYILEIAAPDGNSPG